MSTHSIQTGKLCEKTPLADNIFLSPYFYGLFHLALSKVFPASFSYFFFYFYPRLCADTSTQTCCAITRYRIWSILFLFSELGLFLLGSLFYAEETFPDVYLRNHQFPKKNIVSLTRYLSALFHISTAKTLAISALERLDIVLSFYLHFSKLCDWHTAILCMQC